MDVCRFAPSTTGHAHAGTLLAALLCWLDARKRGARLLLRLEDLDPERCRPRFGDALQTDLADLGLDFDETVVQSQLAEGHQAALDRLAADGWLYPCECSRARIARLGVPAPDGGWRYPNDCRDRALPRGGWRASREPLRVRLPDARVTLQDESGLDLSQSPAGALGDPVVRRRDGAIAYPLAVVVDDAAAGVTRIVRGRDLAASTATQVALQQLLGLPTPRYRHHLLLLEARGQKLAKLHGSVGADAIRAQQTAAALCGFLAYVAGLLPSERPTLPQALLRDFDWDRVADADRVVAFDGRALVLAERTAPEDPATPSHR